MCQTNGLLYILGLIYLTIAAAGFRFPDEVRSSGMPRTKLIPPPPPPPRGLRHSINARQFQRQSPPRSTALGSRPSIQGPPRWRWTQPAQATTSRHNSFSIQRQNHMNQRHPRKLQWRPPVRTLQQILGYGQGAETSQVRYTMPSPRSLSDHREISEIPRGTVQDDVRISSLQQGAVGPEKPSNHPTSSSLTNDEATSFCRRCDLLNPMTTSACCSVHSLCCQQHIPQHSQSHLQQQPQQNYYHLQTPQFGHNQVYQQRNNHQQGQLQAPAHQIFHSDSINIYNGQHPSNNELPYDIRDPIGDDYEGLGDDYEDSEYPDDVRQSSSIGDLVGGAVISMISMAVRSFGEQAGQQREHRMSG